MQQKTHDQSDRREVFFRSWDQWLLLYNETLKDTFQYNLNQVFNHIVESIVIHMN